MKKDDIIELRIKDVLKENGMTQRDLAKALGTSPQYISNLVTGDNNASIKSLKRVAEVLQVPVASLFADYVPYEPTGNAGATKCPCCGKGITVKLEAREG